MKTNETNIPTTTMSSCNFKSLAENLLGWWERHEAEWQANGSNGYLNVKSAKHNLKGGESVCHS